MPIQAGHHNNKAKVATKGNARCTPPSSLLPPRLPLAIRNFSRRHPSLALKMAKSTTSPRASVQNKGTIAPVSTADVPQDMLGLPAFLERPALREVNTHNLYKSCPELKDTPPSYVRENLQLLAPSMLAGLQSATITTSKSQLPQELQVLMSDSLNIAIIAPTHILALSSSKPSRTAGSAQKVALFPIHSMVFAANCSSMPLLPFSAASTPAGNTTRNVTLPVVRFAIPSPESFHILLAYLYSKDADALRHMLLPPDWATDFPTIMQRATFIHGLWANGRAFGVVDVEFWEVIEDCWAEILQTLSELTAWTSSS